MTKIDRYILLLFFRTVFVCFCSIAGIFVVFHAFTKMDDFVELGREQDGMLAVMLRFYGPYMVLLFDMTGTIITLLALLFVVGWLRKSGELTAMLAAGISHGRIFKPMIIASLIIISSQLAIRELALPRLRDALDMKAKNVKGIAEVAVLPEYDKTSGILFEGQAMVPKTQTIIQPSFRLYGDYQGYGDLMMAEEAVWIETTPEHPSGYLLDRVKRPQNIDQLPSIGTQQRAILLTSRDQNWLSPGQCFVATTISPQLLSKDQSSTKLSSVIELAARVRNPAVRTSTSLHVMLHERVVRLPLDFALILLGLPLVVNRRQRNMFVMIAFAILTVLFFFVLKTFASVMGGNGYLISPAIAAWVPLLVIGPVAYVRLRDVQTV
ncbi:LptF/LptG family permease [Planctomycetes bacterium K23_9]|uniref:Putative permease YjgP/YjgQ family protein n=1 Tax=Stieleria marina TaxID=1930275 RepID=A0A517NQU2_9BACT|nr:putative permease YjgP/YjgQ family protein [Planctomycetes bacterium K23_9]